MDTLPETISVKWIRKVASQNTCDSYWSWKSRSGQILEPSSEHVSQDSTLGKESQNQCMTERVLRHVSSYLLFDLLLHLQSSFISSLLYWRHDLLYLPVDAYWRSHRQCLWQPHSSYWVFKGEETKRYNPAVEERVLPWACLWCLKLNLWMGRLLFNTWHFRETSVQFSSVAQLCPTLCDPVNCSTPGLPVHHQLPEFTQTHVHLVNDAIQPSHPLSSPSPLAFNLSQHQGLFKWVNSSHQVAKALEFQLQHQSFQWTFRTDFL